MASLRFALHRDAKSGSLHLFVNMYIDSVNLSVTANITYSCVTACERRENFL